MRQNVFYRRPDLQFCRAATCRADSELLVVRGAQLQVTADFQLRANLVRDGLREVLGEIATIVLRARRAD